MGLCHPVPENWPPVLWFQKFFSPHGRSCLSDPSGVKSEGAKRQDDRDVGRILEQRAAGEGDERTQQGSGHVSVMRVPVQPVSPAVSFERLLRLFSTVAAENSPPEKITCSRRIVRRSVPHGLSFCVSFLDPNPDPDR